MNSDFERKKAALLNEVRDVLNEAESLYNAAMDDGSDQARATKEKLKVQLDKAKAQFADIEEKVTAKAKETALQAHELVQEKPYHALGIAAAAGLVLGMLLRGNNN